MPDGGIKTFLSFAHAIFADVACGRADSARHADVTVTAFATEGCFPARMGVTSGGHFGHRGNPSEFSFMCMVILR